MKLYSAAVFITNFSVVANQYFERLTEVEKKMRLYNPYFLESYYYLIKGSTTKRVRMDGVKLFIDSGAFTAYTKGIEIDLGEYVDYCFKNADIIEHISVLDRIDFDNPARAIKETYRNLLEMERRGLKDVVPTYHIGEPEEVLDHYVKNYSYISIGGMVGVSLRRTMFALDRIWHLYLTNSDGTPKVKVHGFGITSLPAMLRYPWHSVDSSTWVQWSAAGMILLPERGIQINVSNRSSFRKVKGQHLTTVAPRQAKILEDEIIRLGGDPARLAQHYYSRWAFNIFAFPHFLRMREGGMQKFIPEWTGLFDIRYDDNYAEVMTDYDPALTPYGQDNGHTVQMPY